ncbi:MltR family transcriptional regulator [Tardiphaga sp. 839_C3_N1_4]|uniref:MltR family transcriptional regulator n=1 Tax=Tardiphaga sp. 839_C3_N1_4 TaxID=3240761 RepID=UPI003F277BE8
MPRSGLGSGGADEYPKDSVFGDLNRLNRMLDTLDDRGLVLSLAAFAEGALGNLIGAFLIPGDAAKQLLEGFNAPLGTFSARIKMAFSLGLITASQHADLDRLRKIRNAFAHSWEPLSFADQTVAAHITAIGFSNLSDRFPASHHEKLRNSLSSLLLELQVIAEQIKKHSRQAKLIGHHLVAGPSTGTSAGEYVQAFRNRFAEVVEELKTASGEQRRFMLHMLDTWDARLEIVRREAPVEQRNEIKQLQEAMRAWRLLQEK